MTARANPTLALRPFLPVDAPLLADIFRSSIEELTSDDYSQAQQDAWASAADDEAAFSEKLSKGLTLVGTLDGSPVGFISLQGPDQIDMLYDAVEKLAASRGTSRLTADVSDVARDFFERHGFVPQQRNTVLRGGEWLANTTME